MQTDRGIELDDYQRVAADLPRGANGNIVAGAGTGKTTVLVARYMKLVEEDGIAPERLLALTFTLKAAGEMRERVRVAVALHTPELSRRLESAWIMNFHQFGYRFIQENAPALGIDPGIGVMSIAEFHRIRAVLRARFEAGRLDGVPADFGGEPPPPTKLPGLFDSLFKVAQKCRSNMIDPAGLRRRCREDDRPAYLARIDTVVALFNAWELELRRRNLLDFDDMIVIPTRALREHPDVAARYRGAFDHILVDEFQDTSRAQNEMLRAIAGDEFARVTVVGDVKQAIYRWRDARPENVIEFPAERKELLTNYRSVQAVLDLAHALVGKEPLLEGFASPLVAKRGDSVHRPVLFHPAEPGEQVDTEARALADWIEYVLGRVPAPESWGLPALAEPLSPGKVAVLLRRFANSRTRSRIEAEFSRRGIPYAIVGGASTREAHALEAWRELLLLLLPGPRAANLLAVLESKPFLVTEASLHELFAGGDRKAGTTALLADERVARITDTADRAAVIDVREHVARLSFALQHLDFRTFLEWAMERTPLRFELAAAGASGVAVDDVMRELHDLSDTLSQRGLLDLAGYLDHLGAELDARKFREDVDVRLPGDRVALMTIHQAKGLEFEAVAVPGVAPPDPPSDGFFLSPEHGVFFGEKVGKPWKRDMNRDAPDFKQHEAQEELEERCILYVALTRARDHLWVSSPLAEGEKRLKKETRRSFFTDLLDAGRARGNIVEVREADATPASASPMVLNAAGVHDIEELLREWTALRAAAEASDLDARRAPRSLETVTWASLARFAACPLAFSFDHASSRPAVSEESHGEPVAARDLPVAKLPGGVEPARFGAFVHAVLERRSDAETLDTALGHLVSRYDFGRHQDVVVTLARERIMAAIAAGLAGPSNKAQSELPFAVRTPHLLVHGVIDRLDDDGNDALITDYKLGVPAPEHQFQVGVYAWAAHRVLGRDVRARLVYLGLDPVDVESVTVSRATIEATVAALDAALQSGQFEARPGEVCRTCAHRAGCDHAMVVHP